MFKTKKFDWKYIYFGIFLIPLIVNPFGLTPFEIPKQLWMISFIALFSIIFMMMLLPEKKITVEWNPKIYLVVGLWLLSLGISTMFAVAPIESFFGSYDRLQGSLTFLYYLAHFIICLQIFNDYSLKKTFFHITILVGMIVAIHAILQKLHLDPLQIGDITQASGRSYGTLGQPNFLGQWLIFPFACSAMLAFENFKKDHLKKLKTLAYYIFQAILSFAGIFLSYNRGSFLGLAIAGFLFVLYEIDLKKSTKIVIGIIGCALVVVGTVFLTVNDRSGDSRIVLWQNSVPLLTKNILFGSGPESFYQTFQTVLTKNIYLTESLYNIPDRIHNETYQIALDQGLFGLILYIFNILVLGWMYVRQKLKTTSSKIAFFSIIVTIVAVQFSFSLSAQMVFLLTMWAILIRETFMFQTKTFNVTTFPKIIAGIIIVSLGFFGLQNTIGLLQADNLMKQGIGEYIGSSPDALSTMENAIADAPYYRYLPYTEIFFLSLPEYITNHPEAIVPLEEDLKKLRKITNDGYHAELSAAKLAIGEKKTQEAEQHFAAASQKAPNWPEIWQEWGTFDIENQNYSDAVTHFEKLISLAPPYWQWVKNQDSLTFSQKETLRIFIKTQGLFYQALSQLEMAYEQTGHVDKSLVLRKILIDTSKIPTDPPTQL